jgi:hypothetical protein
LCDAHNTTLALICNEGCALKPDPLSQVWENNNTFGTVTRPRSIIKLYFAKGVLLAQARDKKLKVGAGWYGTSRRAAMCSPASLKRTTLKAFRPIGAGTTSYLFNSTSAIASRLAREEIIA